MFTLIVGGIMAVIWLAGAALFYVLKKMNDQLAGQKGGWTDALQALAWPVLWPFWI